MSRPNRITGVGHVPFRTNSYAVVRPNPNARAAVGRSTLTGRDLTSSSVIDSTIIVSLMSCWT
jgi:hypothetical protein